MVVSIIISTFIPATFQDIDFTARVLFESGLGKHNDLGLWTKLYKVNYVTSVHTLCRGAIYPING